MIDSANQEKFTKLVVQSVVNQLLDRALKWCNKDKELSNTQEVIVLPESKDVIIVVTVKNDLGR